MKIFTILCAAVLGVGCANSANTNMSPDRTSLPNANGASNARTNTNGAASNTSAAGSEFLTEAASGGMLEVELGKIASTKAQNAEVKKFAQMMVADHSKANEELKALASQENVAIPAAMNAKHQSTLQRLQGMSGAEFDKAYVEDMVTDHEKDVAEFEKQARDNPDPDVKAFAAKTVPTLKKHLDAIKAIQAKLK